MTGVIALGRLEIRRALRNRRVMFFTILYPVLLFLLSASSVKGKNVPGTNIPYVDYFLVAYASVRRDRRLAQQQRDAHLAGAQGGLDPAVAAHGPAQLRLRGQQDLPPRCSS